jgi:uncharacterized protein YhhL (DUF1145 family)
MNAYDLTQWLCIAGILTVGFTLIVMPHTMLLDWFIQIAMGIVVLMITALLAVRKFSKW